ncbi:MAG: ATP-binding protein [Betaproteobacteria bacterium]|nr:ATP-binding protein [Betaproteobacteria bacterium]
MRRYLQASLKADLARKLVFLVGPRQVGKTTLAKALMPEYPRAQYLDWDVPNDSRIIRNQSWSPRAKLLVLDELHKMRGWKTYLKGAWDGRSAGQAILVTGSARMDTFRQGGESLAGRYFALRLHPVSVREWCAESGARPEDALDRLLERGGFPEPFLAQNASDADRWRRQYLEDLIREDVVEFSRIHEFRAMRLFVQMLRERVGSPLSLASMARDLQVSPTTLAKYLGILEALYVVFTVPPYHRNVARAILKAPKVYFFDNGLVAGDEGARFENACAAMLLKHANYLQDIEGRAASVHYVRDKEGNEIDLVLCMNQAPVLFAECKHAHAAVSRFMASLVARFPRARALQLVREIRQEEVRAAVSVVSAAAWLAELAA